MNNILKKIFGKDKSEKEKIAYKEAKEEQSITDEEEEKLIPNSDLDAIYERIKGYQEKCELKINATLKEIEIVEARLNIKLPEDYKYLLRKSNGIYFYNGITLLGTEDLYRKTSSFAYMMEDWEVGKIKEPFIIIATFHDGEGFVFWYSELKKYVITDYLSDDLLDNIDSLKIKDNLSDVIEYLEKEFKEYFKM